MTAIQPAGSDSLRSVWAFDCKRAITCVDVSTASGTVALGTEGSTILIFNIWEHAQLIGELVSSHPHVPSALSLCPSGDLLVSGTVVGTLHLWDLRFCTEIKNMTLLPNDTAESPDGKPKAVREIVRCHDGQLYAAFIGCVIYIMDDTGAAVSKMMLNGPGHCPTWLHNYTLVCSVDSNIYVWDTPAPPSKPAKQGTQQQAQFQQNVFSSETRSAVTVLAASRTGSQCRLAVACEDGTVTLYSPVPSSNKLRMEYLLSDAAGHISEMSWDSEAKFLTVCSGGKVSTWDTATGEQPAHTEFSVASDVQKVTIHKELPLVVGVTADGSVVFFDASSKSGAPLTSPTLPPPSATRKSALTTTPPFLEWHQNGLLLVSDETSVLELWQVTNPAVTKYLSRVPSLKASTKAASHTNGYDDESHTVVHALEGDSAEAAKVENVGHESCGPPTPHASPLRQAAVSPPSDVSTPVQQPVDRPALLAAATEASEDKNSASATGPVDIPRAPPISQDSEHATVNPIVTAAPPAPHRQELQAAGSSEPATGVEGGMHPPPPPPHGNHASSPTAGMPPWAKGGSWSPQGSHNVPMPPYYMQPGWFPTSSSAVTPAIPGHNRGAGMGPILPPNCNGMPAVMPGMMNMMPHPGMSIPQWSAYQQMQAAQWQMQQQQQAAYMNYYGSGMHPNASVPMTSGMYTPMQMTPPSLMPPHGGGSVQGVSPGMEGHERGEQYGMQHPMMGDPRHQSHGSGRENMQNVLTLYVGNLPSRIDEHALLGTFYSFGPVHNIQVIRDKATGLSRGFAFITFEYPSSAGNAMCSMNGVVLPGLYENRTLRVAPSNRAQRVQTWSWNA